MTRHFTTWLTIVAMLAGIALPASALGQVMRAGAMSGDFCSAAGSKAPAQPAHGHAQACDACCKCSAGSPGMPAKSAAPAQSVASVAPVVDCAAPELDELRITVRARGPPAFA